MKVYAYNNAEALLQSPFLDSYKQILTEMLLGRNVDVGWYFNCMPETTIFMVEEANEIVAISVVSILDEYWLKKIQIQVSNPDTYMITSVYTKETHRKKGYAKKMIQSIPNYYPNVVLETYAHWVPAMTLYLSTGFKPTDTKIGELGHVILFKKGQIDAQYV